MPLSKASLMESIRELLQGNITSPSEQQALLVEMIKSLGERTIDPELILKIYAEVRAYDIHYSTVRSALSTFVVGLGVGLAAIVLKAHPSPSETPVAIMWLVLVVPLSFFVVAGAISSYFMQLTRACEIIEAKLENNLAAVMSFKPLLDSRALQFRNSLRELCTPQCKKLSPTEGKKESEDPRNQGGRPLIDRDYVPRKRLWEGTDAPHRALLVFGSLYVVFWALWFAPKIVQLINSLVQ